MNQATAATRVLRQQAQLARAFAKQDQIARAFGTQDQAVQAVSRQTGAAQALAQYEQLAQALARQTQTIRQAAEATTRALGRPGGPMFKLARAMTDQGEALARIADSPAMSDLARLRNQVAHFSANQAEVVQKFAEQHETVLRLLDERTRSLDFATWRHYVRATGTVTAPRDARGKPVVVLTGRDTCHRPFLAGFLREQGWHVVELHPYDQRSAFDSRKVRQDQMLGYERRTDRGQARAPCRRERRVRDCSEEILLRADLVQQTSRQVEGGADACPALRLPAGGLHRALDSRGRRLGVEAHRVVYRRLHAAGSAVRRIPPRGKACSAGAAYLRLG